MNDLGHNIKKARQEKGISLSALARQAGISKGYLSSIENGEQISPSVYIVAAIAEILGKEIKELIVRRSITAYMRGHLCWYDTANTTWRYMDDDSVFDDTRVCPQCGKLPTSDGHDSCIGYIKGATSVCCGHGIEDGYVVWGNNGDSENE